MVYTSSGNGLRSEGSSSGCSLETSRTGQFWLTLVGSLLATIALRNHITDVVGLAYTTIHEAKASGILEVQVVVVITTLPDNGCVIFQRYCRVVGHVRQVTQTRARGRSRLEAFNIYGQYLINRIALATLLVGGYDSKDVVGLAVGGQLNAEGLVIDRAAAAGIAEGTVIGIGHADRCVIELHIVCPIGMTYLRAGNRFGGKINVATLGSETGRVLQLGLGVVGHLQATITLGNHITLLVLLIHGAVNEAVTGLVLHVHGGTSLLQHGSIIAQNELGIVSDTAKCAQTDAFAREDKLGGYHSAGLAILYRHSLHGRVLVQRESASVLC